MSDVKMRLVLDTDVWSFLLGLLIGAEVDPDTPPSGRELANRARQAISRAEPLRGAS